MGWSSYLTTQVDNKNCENQMRNEEFQKFWSDKVVNSHNDFKINEESLSDQKDLESANSNQKITSPTR